MVCLVVVTLILLVLSRIKATIIHLSCVVLSNIVGSTIEETVLPVRLSLLILVFLLCRFLTFVLLTTECEKWDSQVIVLLGPWLALITM